MTFLIGFTPKVIIREQKYRAEMITTFQTCYKPVTKSGKCLVFMNRLLQFREISILPDLRNRFIP